MKPGTAVRADALWRALTFLSVAQLHLIANPLLSRPLSADHVKERPTGHWGTVPGTAWALTHIGLAADAHRELEVVPVLGAGHAGVVQLALAWLTGDLATIRPEFGPTATGLEALVAAFPAANGLGSEVHPQLPAGAYVGGWLGGALAFAQGAALDAPWRVVVPVLGDGECETPTTAAAWLAHRALSASRVVAVVHLNGHRMGGPSLLGSLSDAELASYAAGVGWEPRVVHVDAADRAGRLAEHAAFHTALMDGIERTRHGGRPVIFLRCVKGWTGPLAAHKTPLTRARSDAQQRWALRRWLLGYRPEELFDSNGCPIGDLAEALTIVRFCQLQPRDRDGDRRQQQLSAEAGRPPVHGVEPPRPTFATAIADLLHRWASAGHFKVFSPDELLSNQLPTIAGQAWALEVLAEEVLLGWLAGWTLSGRRGVLISYEAFAPLLLTGLVAQLKQRRLTSDRCPSLNLLLTSYGWQNAYTHADPSLTTALAATGDPSVRVLTPADPARAAAALDDALASDGLVNVIVAGKHATACHPLDTLDEERTEGLAVWKHLSDEGQPDLTLICAGDLPAAVVEAAAHAIRRRHRCRVRVVNATSLTALSEAALHRNVGDSAAVIVATLGHPAAVWGQLAGRLERPCEVLGWREPPHPMPQDELAAFAGLSVDGVIAAADRLLSGRLRRA
ncbi:xylulose-5-phosphate/fructose-6-phosphate phosphoketolase [Geodermatophilus obscurus]|uniref:Xylulose-5-phosphate/fructose-6-phosphate phosphoketolase n=1 Tax=Geodermatophilus obscurus TaxID=1861 RepID=A0A1M7S2H0_9ACTN|nr:hypothetical protein [Geodermatophilus obscurus]SHN52658.1 xylulose-5-phosphate/fructose-6-phosphate phosphoketolase [Geodermatophilus obscurus]